MIFDTDILIFVQKKQPAAVALLERADTRLISAQTYMELIQGARSKKDVDFSKDFIIDFSFQVLPLSENIGNRAIVYLEEYAASHGLMAGDAIIAATAVENSLTLVTANVKHFKPIHNLKLIAFKP